MAAAAAPVSLAATGLSAFSSISAGMTASDNALGQAQNALDQASQTSAYDKFKAKSLADSAEYGRVSAAQTDADLRLVLGNKLATNAAVRGAANVDPSSPTGAAIAARTSEVGDLDREQRVGNIMAQVGQDQLASAYYRSAGADALRIGQMQADQYEQNASSSMFGGILGALSTGLGALAGPVAGGSSIFGNTSLPNNRKGGLIGFG